MSPAKLGSLYHADLLEHQKPPLPRGIACELSSIKKKKKKGKSRINTKTKCKQSTVVLQGIQKLDVEISEGFFSKIRAKEFLRSQERKRKCPV